MATACVTAESFLRSPTAPLPLPATPTASPWSRPAPASNFSRRRRAGERLTALATEVSRGARHGVYDVRVTKSSGETVALFRGRCARLRSQPNGIPNGISP